MPRWTAESRARQAEIARQNRPWAHSTGPKTPEGKARMRYNAYKTGLHTKSMRKYRKALRLHAHFLQLVRVVMRHSAYNAPTSHRNNTEKEYKSSPCGLIFNQSRPILYGKCSLGFAPPPRQNL